MRRLLTFLRILRQRQWHLIKGVVLGKSVDWGDSYEVYEYRGHPCVCLAHSKSWDDAFNELGGRVRNKTGIPSVYTKLNDKGDWVIYFGPSLKMDGYYYYERVSGPIDKYSAELIRDLLVEYYAIQDEQDADPMPCCPAHWGGSLSPKYPCPEDL